jgi:hypothetical protein
MGRSIAFTRARGATAWLLLVVAGAALAGCESTKSEGPSASALPALPALLASKPAEEPPMTRSRAAMECWMKTEKGSANANLDKRADTVTKCINDKMKTAQAAPRA